MNLLPLEVHENIFSFLSFNNRVKCRSVCRSLKSSVEHNLSSLTHLRIRKDETAEENEEKFLSYPQEQFFSGPFVHLFIKDISEVRYKLCQFLGHFCPNLRVLDADCLPYTGLLQISFSLRYLRCYVECELYDFMLPSVHSNISTDMQTDGTEVLKARELSLFEPFSNLQVLDAGQEDLFDSFTFSRHLLQQDKPVSMVKIDLKPNLSIDSKFYESLASCRLACLELYVYSSPSPTIPKVLAEHLVDLTIHFESKRTHFYRNCEEFANSPFPRLNYLTLTCEYPFNNLEPNIYSCLVSSLPPLKRFTFRGRMGFDHLRQLFDQLKSIETLKAINFNMYRYFEETTLKIHLPSQVTRFTLKRNVPFELVSATCNHITFFDASFVKMYNSTMASLRVICLSLTEQSQFHGLMDFLLHSPQLRSLKIHWQMKPSKVQLLIDTLPNLVYLKHIELTGDYNSESVTIQQAKFASVQVFTYSLQLRTFFYPTDSFDSLEVHACSISFKSTCTCYTFSRDWVTVVETPLKRINRLYIFNILSPDLGKILHLLEMYSKVKHVQFDINEYSWYSKHYYNEKYEMFIEWLSSCSSLTSVTGPFDEMYLTQFINNLASPGPLEFAVRPFRAKII